MPPERSLPSLSSSREDGRSLPHPHDVAETTDEDPARVAAVARLTAAYLRSAFDPDDPAWRTAGDQLAAESAPFGRIESK